MIGFAHASSQLAPLPLFGRLTHHSKDLKLDLALEQLISTAQKWHKMGPGEMNFEIFLRVPVLLEQEARRIFIA